jgi:fatty acid desaturase
MPENHMFVEVILQFVYFFLQPLNMTLKVLIIPIVKRKKPDFWYAVPLTLFAFFYLFNGSLLETLKIYLFMYGLFGLILGRILFCGHRLQELWTEGAEKIEDFGEHTVSSSNDTDTWLRGFWSYAFTAGLNIHNAHHFFPTADHAILPAIMDIIDETCKEMKIQYHRTSRLQCFKSLSKGFIHRIPWERNPEK